MTFLHSWILLFLPLILVPAVMYFLRRLWTRKVEWAAMTFLIQACHDTQPQRRRSELARLALQTILVFAVIVLVASPVFKTASYTSVQNSAASSQERLPNSVVFIYDSANKSIDSPRTAQYLQAAFKQISPQAEFTLYEKAKANPIQILQADIVILHGMKSVPAWLEKAIAQRREKKKALWIFAPEQLEEAYSARLASCLPPKTGNTAQKKTPVRLYEKIDINSSLWSGEAFKNLKDVPIPFPSENNPGFVFGNQWKSAFIDSNSVLYKGSCWIFNSSADGVSSAWSFCDFWIPLLQRATEASLAAQDEPETQIQYLPGKPRLSIFLAAAGLIILIRLFWRYGWITPRSRAADRAFSWTCFILAGLVLSIMIAQARFTPVVWVKPAILLLRDNTQSMLLPQGRETALSRKTALVQWAKDNSGKLAVLKKSYRLFDSPFSSPESAEEIIDISRWIEKIESDPCPGRQTNVEESLTQALASLEKRVDKEAIQQVILLSDGRNTDIQKTETKLHVKEIGNQLQITALAFGDFAPAPNVRLEKLQLDSLLFAKHPAQIQAELYAQSLRGKQVEITLKRRRIIQSDKTKESKSSEETVARQTIAINSADYKQNVSFDFIPEQAGRYLYIIEAAEFKEEFTLSDNALSQSVQVEDKQIKVLLVSSGPNWEFRYLRNLLARTGTFHLAVVLQNASKEYVKEDSCAISAFPASAEALNAYDALIFINARLDWLTPSSREALRQFFQSNGENSNGAEGTSKAVIGFWNAKTDFAPVAALEPRWLPFDVTAVKKEVCGAGTQARLTPLGQTTPWLRLSADDSNSLWASLAPLGEAVRVSSLKPAVKTLIESGNSQPIVTQHALGKARIATVFTDSLWRWRKGAGEAIYNRIQLQLIRGLIQPNSAALEAKQNSEIINEWRNTAADREALQKTAETHNGKMYTYQNGVSIWNNIPERVNNIFIVRPPVDLWNQAWLMAILLILLFWDWSRFYFKN